MNQEAQPELAVLSCFVRCGIWIRRWISNRKFENFKSQIRISDFQSQISDPSFEMSDLERRIAAGFPPVGGVFAGLFIAIALFIVQGGVAFI